MMKNNDDSPAKNFFEDDLDNDFSNEKLNENSLLELQIFQNAIYKQMNARLV